MRVFVRYRLVWYFLVAVPSINGLTNANSNRQLSAVGESQQDLFPEFWVIQYGDLGNRLADDFREFQLRFSHPLASLRSIHDVPY